MRKAIAVGAAGIASLGSMTSTAEDYQGAFRNAPHMVTETCAQRLVDELPRSWLTRLVSVDIANAEEENRPSESETHERAKQLDVGDYPLVDEYIEKHVEFVQTVRLPQSLITLNLYSDSPKWEIEPFDLDEMLSATLLSVSGNKSLQALEYQCLYEEIYEKKNLSTLSSDLYILGTEEPDGLCYVGQRLVPSSLGICLKRGYFYGKTDRIVLTPRTDNPARSAWNVAAHEFGHMIQDTLRAESSNSSYREHFADTFQPIAVQLADERELEPFHYSGVVNCSNLVELRLIC